MLGRLVNSNFLQQSNLQPRTPRTPEKVPAAQQCNLRLSMATSPLHQDSLGVLAPRLLQTPPAAEPHCPDPRPTAGVAPLCGRTWPGPRFWGGLGGRTSKLTGEPLTLEDLAIPALRQAWHPSHAPIHQPLASVQYLEHQAARLRGQVPREPPSPAQRDPCPGSGQGLPAHPQSSRPLLASWDERRRHPRGHRETTDLLVAQGPHTDRSDSRAPSKPASPKTTLGLRTGHYHDSEQATLPAQPLRPGDEGAPGPTHGSGDRGHPAGSLGFSSAATAGSVLPGREGDVHIPRELGRRKASWSLDVDVFLARRAVLQNKAQDCVAPEGHPAARRQLLSRCFRSWRRMAHRVLSHRQLLREGFRALQWTLWLQEARLEVAWRRHSKALLAQTFREWRLLVQREKQGQHLVQAASGPCTSWGARDQVTCWGREAVGRPTPSSRCFWAWQRVAQRGAQCQGRLAEHCVRTLRRCLGRWVQMKQLRASDQAAVTQLSLCRQEAGALALWSSAHGVEMVARASLQGACHTLALHRALLLQGMRLSQHQRAK
ncbi:hypothetical protein H920_06991 [Fukomys damarensis]|uniref:Uncharacterized protein n=1 Tax=Fukomys damarensis TaxID=885580 RepID=A0A091DMW0_FUKDA|nr:hypothetical protein H920_06991 [Fukomys damarensis]